MIQFRYGANRSGRNSAFETKNECMRMYYIGSVTHATKENTKASSSVVNKTGATSQAKAVQQAGTFEFAQTPAKYRRRSLTQEEIDLVAVSFLLICSPSRSIVSLFFYRLVDLFSPNSF